MTKAAQCASVHDAMWFFLFFRLFAGQPLKLLAESRWNQSGVNAHTKYQIRNLKPVLYESEMNTIWMEVNKKQNGKKKNPRQSKSTSPDGINEQKGLCNYTNFCCRMNV